MLYIQHKILLPLYNKSKIVGITSGDTTTVHHMQMQRFRNITLTLYKSANSFCSFSKRTSQSCNERLSLEAPVLCCLHLEFKDCLSAFLGSWTLCRMGQLPQKMVVHGIAPLVVLLTVAFISMNG